MKTIAIDLDDVLNNFTETLQRMEFVRDETHALSEKMFQDYLAKVRGGWTESNGLLSTAHSFFRYKIHQRCYERAQARTDGVSFTQWLRSNGWRIVICTYRDLRRAQDCTRKWLADNAIPFDYLFMTRGKIAFCKAWGIEHLIDDQPKNIALGERFGVNVYYPAAARPPAPAANPVQTPGTARAFHTFDEIKPWIQG
jgi:5'(3')-deoxyribonucleotidase